MHSLRIVRFSRCSSSRLQYVAGIVEVAELSPRLEARGLGLPAERDELVRAHVEVEGELLLDGGGRAAKEAEPEDALGRGARRHCATRCAGRA